MNHFLMNADRTLYCIVDGCCNRRCCCSIIEKENDEMHNVQPIPTEQGLVLRFLVEIILVGGVLPLPFSFFFHSLL